MHKKLMLLVLVFLLVGCSEIRSDNSDYIGLVKNCLNKNVNTNEVSLGYRYYVPKGVHKIRDYDYNQAFKFGDNYIYLYVDIVSYFYKKDIKIDDNGDYFRNINYNGNKGYIKVNKKDDKYLVDILYHYSKVEFYADKNSLSKLITVSSIILNSVRYNDVVIERVLEGDLGRFSEFTYSLDKPEDTGNNFSQYLEEYVQKEEKENKNEQLPDE